MIPVKIDENGRQIPVVTLLLIVGCTVVFVRQHPSVESFGLKPLYFVHGLLHPREEITNSLRILIVSFFLHGGLIHLAGNMWYLWLFGNALEKTIGSLRFIIAYIVFGIVSMLTQIANDPLSVIPIVGASGAIAGVMGMYLVLRPLSKIVFLIPPFFSFRLYSSLFLIFWFYLQWKNIDVSNKTGNMIAWWAHIGGFLCGMLYGFRVRVSKRNQKGKRGKEETK